jgi:hypothetical protein
LLLLNTPSSTQTNVFSSNSDFFTLSPSTNSGGAQAFNSNAMYFIPQVISSTGTTARPDNAGTGAAVATIVVPSSSSPPLPPSNGAMLSMRAISPATERRLRKAETLEYQPVHSSGASSSSVEINMQEGTMQLRPVSPRREERAHEVTQSTPPRDSVPPKLRMQHQRHHPSASEIFEEIELLQKELASPSQSSGELPMARRATVAAPFRAPGGATGNQHQS